MTTVDSCRTKKRGRPAKPGRSIRITVRLHEADHPEVLARLEGVARGKRSAYVRRVLAGAPVEVLDQALEDPDLSDSLDGMWEDDWDDE